MGEGKEIGRIPRWYTAVAQAEAARHACHIVIPALGYTFPTTIMPMQHSDHHDQHLLINLLPIELTYFFRHNFYWNHDATQPAISPNGAELEIPALHAHAALPASARQIICIEHGW